MRGELLGLMRPCIARVEPWLRAGKYAAAVMSDLPKRNGWTFAERAGDRTPDRMQRLLNRAAWDAFTVMGVVRRFAPDPGMSPLTVPGTMRLPGRPPPPGSTGHWLDWRRRHQARSRWYHQPTRLARHTRRTPWSPSKWPLPY
jgi:hypothetical protein